jgi:hypothetical protein
MPLSRINNPFLSSSGAGNASITSPAANTVAFTTATTERMRIDSSGLVGIGTASPAHRLDVSGNIRTSSVMFLAGGDGSIQRSGGNSWLMLSSNTGYNSSGVHLKLDSSSAAGAFNFFSVGTSILEMAGTNTPLVLQGGSSSAGVGIAFPSTQSASTNANTLDDYEEGTWTPTVFHTSTNNSTHATRVGNYIKIGKLVIGFWAVDAGNSGTAGSALVLGGLPFSAQSYAGSNITFGNWGSNTGPQVGNITNNTGTQALLYIGGQQQTAQVSYTSGTVIYMASA